MYIPIFTTLVFFYSLLGNNPLYALEMEGKPDLSQATLEDEQLTLPSGYQHRNVQTQIRSYRNIYDRAFANLPSSVGNKELNFSSIHIEGLFTILQNGFALIHDYVRQHEADRGEANSELALSRLKKVYELAHLLNQEKRMTQYNFVEINCWLAKIVDAFKGSNSFQKDLEGTLDKSSFEKIPLSSDCGNYSPYAGFKWTGIIDYDPPAGRFSVVYEEFRPPFIIYTNNPKTKIGLSTFVDQALNYDYPGSIILFDVNTMESPDLRRLNSRESPYGKFIRKDPHFGNFNGTKKMMSHDLAHIREQFAIEQLLKEDIDVNWRTHLLEINKLRLKLSEQEDRNSYAILTHGLFILTHEFFNVSRDLKKYSTLPQNKRSFINILMMVKNSMVEDTKGMHRKMVLYAQDFKDFEFILRNVRDLHGNLILPDKSQFKKFDSEKKQKLVSKGYKKFWDTFLHILKEYQVI